MNPRSLHTAATATRRGFLATAALSVAALSACAHTSRTTTDRASPDQSASPTDPPPAETLGDDQRDRRTTTPETTADDYRTPTDWGTHLPGIHASVPTHYGRPTLALTFDACGGPRGSAVDHPLLELLREFAVPATLFLNERWIRSNPSLAAELASDPLFQLENHGTRHVPLSVTGRAAYGIAGTATAAAVAEEIEFNRRYLYDAVGVRSTWFRSGTAHYDDVAVEIAHSRGIQLAGFAVNADAGATATSTAVTHQLATAPDGAIVLAHMNQPSGGTAAGMRAALAPLRDKGTRFVHLGAQT
jgi:peptidoglycan/xylan/chitin deacetylase (PgdA/CDA1 family)